MRKLSWILGGVVACAGLAAPATAGSGATRFEAVLSGDNEVPPVVTDAGGLAFIEFNEAETRAEFELRVRLGKRVTQAHIHCAGPNENGPIVAFLVGFHDKGWDVNGHWVQNARLANPNVIPSDPGMNPSCPVVIQNLADLAEALRQGYGYVNVHSLANPAGEVRGQIEED